MRILVFIITALIQAVFAVIAFFTLLLGMNGYSEKQATPGLVFFVIISVANALGLGGASAYAAKRLVEKKSFGRFVASFTAVAGFSIIGALIVIAGFFAALILAEVMRGSK